MPIIPSQLGASAFDPELAMPLISAEDCQPLHMREASLIVFPLYRWLPLHESGIAAVRQTLIKLGKAGAMS